MTNSSSLFGTGSKKIITSLNLTNPFIFPETDQALLNASNKILCGLVSALPVWVDTPPFKLFLTPWNPRNPLHWRFILVILLKWLMEFQYKVLSSEVNIQISFREAKLLNLILISFQNFDIPVHAMQCNQTYKKHKN